MADTDTWAWIGGTSPLITSSLAGTTVPLGGYQDDVVYNDVNNDGLMTDLDGNTSAPAGEGVTINGTFYQFEQFTVWDATLEMSDGTIIPARLHVHRLDDDTLYFRVGDSVISSLDNAGYVLDDFSSITLDTLRTDFENISIANHDDPFPVCFCAGTLITTRFGKVAIETLTAGALVETKDHGLQQVRLIVNRRVKRDQVAA